MDAASMVEACCATGVTGVGSAHGASSGEGAGRVGPASRHGKPSAGGGGTKVVPSPSVAGVAETALAAAAPGSLGLATS
ncbi:MAG: hypothetical protein MUF01_17860, partial [Bryobacterales bacterium]|nr:hypothetical protein [Bryobacterales bacterium]